MNKKLGEQIEIFSLPTTLYKAKIIALLPVESLEILDIPSLQSMFFRLDNSDYK